MKKPFLPLLVAFVFIMLLAGCIAVGTGPRSQPANATLGQQLIDLQTAKNTGAITDAEYQAKKAKLLGDPPGNPTAK